MWSIHDGVQKRAGREADSCWLLRYYGLIQNSRKPYNCKSKHDLLSHDAWTTEHISSNDSLSLFIAFKYEKHGMLIFICTCALGLFNLFSFITHGVILTNSALYWQNRLSLLPCYPWSKSFHQGTETSPMTCPYAVWQKHILLKSKWEFLSAFNIRGEIRKTDKLLHNQK